MGQTVRWLGDWVRFLVSPTGLIIVAVCVGLILLMGWRSGCTAAREARSQRDVAVATGDALDRVAEQTPAIRAEQAEKERAVDEIEGSDQRLPDGYGAELERLRRRDRDRDPR